MTTVSGIVRDTQQNPAPGANVSLVYKKALVGYDGGVAVQNKRLFVADANGLVTMDDLVPGDYDFYVSIVANDNTTLTILQAGTMRVLEQATQTWESAVTETVGTITPTVLQQAINAKDAAEAAENALATVAYERAQTFSGVRGQRDYSIITPVTRADEVQLFKNGQKLVPTLSYTVPDPGTLRLAPIIDVRSDDVFEYLTTTRSTLPPDTPYTFELRSELVSEIAEEGALAGRYYFADGLTYFAPSGGSSVIADLPGLVPVAPVSFKHFGASGKNSGNDANAIASALASGYEFENDGQDIYRATSPIVVEFDGDVYVRGGEIRFEQASSGVGVEIVRSEHTGQKRIIDLDNLEITTVNSNTTKGLFVRWDPALTSVAQLDTERFYPHLRLGKGFAVRPVNEELPTQYFSFANIHLEDVQGPQIDGVYLGNAKNAGRWVDGTRGIYITANGSPVKMDFKNLHIRHCEKAVDVASDVEGFWVSGGTVVACRHGYLFNPPTPGYENLGMFFRSIHTNTAETGILVSNGGEVFINDCEIYKYLDLHDWSGVSLGQGAGNAVRAAFVTENIFTTVTGSGVNAARAISIGDLNKAIISQNQGSKIDAGVFFDGTLTARKDIFVGENFWEADASKITDPNTQTWVTGQTSDNSLCYVNDFLISRQMINVERVTSDGTTNLNNVNRNTLFRYTLDATNAPLAGTAGNVSHFEHNGNDASQVATLVFPAGEVGRTFVRSRDAGVWQGWGEMFTAHSPAISVKDAMSAPTAISGRALIYVDAVDGDLKVRFGDGVTKTLATDT